MQSPIPRLKLFEHWSIFNPLHDIISQPQRSCLYIFRQNIVSSLFPYGIGLTAYLGLTFIPGTAVAQIVPDSTLGAENSSVSRDVPIQGALGDRIDGGAIRGNALFHSFESFNVDALQRVYFANPVGIETILSRVTGTDISDIFGTLGVDGQANLFLLNPNGFVFGENASLDVRGSFMATTATGFTLPNGNVFSAVDPEAPPLLTMSITPGLQYGANPGAIANQADLDTGRSLTLSAGSITNSGNLNADGGGLILEAITGDVVVTDAQLNADKDALIQALGSISIDNAVWNTGGELRVQSDDAITISGSELSSGRDMVFHAPIRQLTNPIDDNTYTTGGYFVTEDGNGNIVDFIVDHHPNVIRADGDVQIDANYNGASLYVLAGGAVTPAPGVTAININGNANNPITPTIGDGQGNNQQVTIEAGPQTTLDVRSGINWNAMPGGAPGNTNTSAAAVTFGNGGNPTGITDATIDLANNAAITIQNPAGNVYLSNQYQPNGDLTGNIAIHAVDAAALASGGNLGLISRNEIGVTGIVNVSPLFFFLGEAGDVSLIANDDIFLSPGTTIESVGTIGGDIELISDQGNLDFSDSFIFSLSLDTGNRNSPTPGNITLTAQSIFLSNFARLANAAGLGNQPGGRIDINAADAVSIITTAGNSLTTGSNDLITLFLQSFRGTGIVTATIGNASGGNLNLNTQELIIRNDTPTSDPAINDPGDFLTGLSSATFPFLGDRGDAGTIRISTDTITIDGNQPGNFFILDRAELANNVVAIRTGITSASQGAGLAGNLIINTRELLMQEGAAITTGHVALLDTIVRSTQAEDPRITVINASERISLTGKAAIAAATISQGDSSDLSINVSESGEGLFLQDGAIIAADSLITRPNPGEVTAGAAGNIDIVAPVVQLTNNSRIGSASGNSGGAPGTITTNVETLEVINSLISTSSENDAQMAGNIVVNATDSVRVIGTVLDPIPNRLGGIAAEATLEGDAGTITVDTPQLNIGEAGAILTSTNSGEGGSIQLQNIDTLTITNGAISASTQTGTAGSISVNANSTAADQIVVQGPDGLLAAAATGTGGTAGDVILNTQILHVLDGAQVSTSNVASSVGGSIQLRGVDTLELNQGQITASTQTGTAGNVQINQGEGAAARILVQGEGSAIAAQAEAAGGSAGDVSLNSQIIQVKDGAGISASNISSSTGGSIQLEGVTSLELNNGQVTASTEQGTAGNVTVNSQGTAAAQIVLTGPESAIAAQATTNSGNAGGITLNTQTLQVLDGAEITTSTQGGTAGNITVQADNGPADTNGPADSIVISGNGSAIAAQAEAPGGRAGSIILNTETLDIDNGATVSTSNISSSIRSTIQLSNIRTLTLDEGQITTSTQDGLGGTIQLNQAGSHQAEVQLTNSQINTAAFGRGDAGGIDMRVRSLSMTDNATISAAAQSGQAGGITVEGRSLFMDNADILASSQSGQGGNILLEDMTTIQLEDSTITASTQSGVAGRLRLEASNQVRLNHSQLSVEANARGGTAGRLTVVTPQLRLGDRSTIEASTVNEQAGNIVLQAVEALTIIEDSAITASTRNGVAGNITLNRDQQAADTVRLVNGRIETEARGSGDAGGIDLNGRSLTMSDQSTISATTASGQGGDIELNGQFLSMNGNSEISASTQSGQGGDIVLNGLTSVFLQNSEVTASTDSGIAGRLQVSAENSIQLNNSALSVEATASGGQAGDVNIDATNLSLENNARITVSSPQGQAGNINITTNRLTLDASTISAETGQNDPSNPSANNGRAIDAQIGRNDSEGRDFATVTLTGLELLLMRNSSLISAEANGDANGGNIVIDAPSGLIIAPPLENSDVIATAVNGKGGTITLSALRIFGLQERAGDRDTLRSNSSNDISASSDAGIDGTIVLRELAIDPSRGLADLPSALISNADRLEQNICQASSNSSFIAVGRGGLPATPTDLFTSDDIWPDQRLTAIAEESVTSSNATPDTTTHQTHHELANPDTVELSLMEAQHWVRDEMGAVVLMAQTSRPPVASNNMGNDRSAPATVSPESAPNRQPQSQWRPFLSCESSHQNGGRGAEGPD